MKMLAVLLFSTFMISVCYSIEYTHHIFADPEEKYEMWWSFDEENIHVKLQVQTQGWIGWGLSQNGAMKGSDMVLAWFQKGVAKIQDTHAVGTSRPVEDEQQDYSLLEMKKNGSHITVVFQRKLELCNKDDFAITTDTMRLMWAYGDTSIPSYHKKRGSRSIYLLDYTKRNTVKLPSDVEVLDIRMDGSSTLPAKETFYACYTMKIEKGNRKRHLIRVEPLIQPGNENLVHHILFYRCKKFANDSHLGIQHKCSDKNMPGFINDCNQGDIISGWAVGGTIFDYPEEAGYPFNVESDSGYYMLQVHYDNPKLRKNMQDGSGIKLYFTNQLRKYDAATISAGVMVTSFSPIIPQHQKSFTWTGVCNSKCLNKNASQERPKIHATLLHTHLKGVKIIARLVRDVDGVETNRIEQDRNYDFNYQEFKARKEDLEIPIGHSIHIECTYNTEKVSDPVFGGKGTRQEMCLAFLLIYPPIGIRHCLSHSTAGDGDFQRDVLKWKIDKDGLIDQSLEINGKNFTGEPAWKPLHEAELWSRNPNLAGEWQKYQVLPKYKPFCGETFKEFLDGPVLKTKLTKTLSTGPCVKEQRNPSIGFVKKPKTLLYICSLLLLIILVN